MRRCFSLNKEERLKLIEEGRKLRVIRFNLNLSIEAFSALIAKYLPPDVLPNRQIVDDMELGKCHDKEIYNKRRAHIVKCDPKTIEEFIECLTRFKSQGR